MRFPLLLGFKGIAIARQATLEDSSGQVIWYARSVTLFSERYSIERTGALTPDEELLLSLGLLVVGFLEKERV